MSGLIYKLDQTSIILAWRMRSYRGQTLDCGMAIQSAHNATRVTGNMTMLTNTMLKQNPISSAILAATMAATTSLAAHAKDQVGAARSWLQGMGYSTGLLKGRSAPENARRCQRRRTGRHRRLCERRRSRFAFDRFGLLAGNNLDRRLCLWARGITVTLYHLHHFPLGLR